MPESIPTDFSLSLTSKAMAKSLDELRARTVKTTDGKKPLQKKKPETFGDIALSWGKTILGAIAMVMIINGLLIASFVVPTGSMERTVMTGDFLFVNKFIYGPSTPQLIPFINVPLPYLRFPGIRDPRRGDVIVFIFPGNRDEVEDPNFQYYLKRCIAVSGDVLEVRNNEVFINGQKQAMPPEGVFDPSALMGGEELQTFPPGKGYTHDNYGPVKVPTKGDVIQLTVQNYQEWFTFIRREGHEVDMSGTTIRIDGKPATSYKVERNYCFGMGDNRDHSLDSRFWGFIPVENVVGTPIMVYWSWNTSATSLGDKFSSIRWGRIGTFID